MTAFHVVIPARYGSTRLPAKVLRPLAGRPMIAHVYERAQRSGAQSVCIATDDHRVREAAEAFGAKVVMTSGHHQSGTERIAEAVERLGLDDETIVVNLQGDEPLMPPDLLHQAASALAAYPAASVATLCMPIEEKQDLFDPNLVKVVTDSDGMALYFSRAPIPWARGVFPDGPLPAEFTYYRHLGVYAYRAGFLTEFVSWPHTALEDIEALEQLRALWYGRKVLVAIASEACPPGVDTEQDLRRAEASLAGIGDAEV